MRDRMHTRFRHVLLTFTLVAGCFLPVSASAQQLPSMDEMPWTGFFSGHLRHGFEFGVNNEGECEIYLMGKGRKRVGETRKVRIYTEVIVELPDGETVRKRLKKDVGFSTDQKPGLKHKEIQFTAECYGDAKVEIGIKYDGNEITMDGKILDRGTFKEGKMSLGFKVMVPAMYTSTYAGDDDKSKARMRRDRIKFVRVKDQKTMKLKSYEDVDLNEDSLAGGGVTELSVSMNGMERRTFHFTTTDGKGNLAFENKTQGRKGKLWQGYVVRWEREWGDEGVAAFVIEVK